MASAARHIGITVVLACLALTGCATTRQHTDLILKGDLPTSDMRGRTALARRRAVQASDERPVTAALPCPSGDAASLTRCRERADQMKVAPIALRLGKPPRPADIARREAPSGIDDPAARERARAAYADAVRERYRTYATYVAGQLAGVDWIDITDADDVVHRYRGHDIAGGLDVTLVAMGDRYGAVEWNQFLRERPPEAAARAPAPAEHPAARTAPAERTTRSGELVGPLPEEPKPEAVREKTEPPAAESGPDEPAVSVSALSPGPPCRRSCVVRSRVCVAGCREQPVSGGGYTPCMQACEDDAAACRERCRTP
jgi:hypothetical protein